VYWFVLRPSQHQIPKATLNKYEGFTVDSFMVSTEKAAKSSTTSCTAIAVLWISIDLNVDAVAGSAFYLNADQNPNSDIGSQLRIHADSDPFQKRPSPKVEILNEKYTVCRY
jgi:hypothetical protein